MGAGSIWAVALGSIIGWGCFIQGGLWTQRAGGPLPLFLGFLVGGLLMIVVGYSYSYMIAKFPVAGGEFAYAYKGFGRTASYICGWMLSLGYLSIVALNATALPVLASYIFPGVFNKGYLYTIAGYDVYMGEVAIALFFIILFGIMNYMGAKSVGKLQLAMVLIMCAAVVISVVGTIVTGSLMHQILHLHMVQEAKHLEADLYQFWHWLHFFMSDLTVFHSLLRSMIFHHRNVNY